MRIEESYQMDINIDFIFKNYSNSNERWNEFIATSPIDQFMKPFLALVEFTYLELKKYILSIPNDPSLTISDQTLRTILYFDFHAALIPRSIRILTLELNEVRKKHLLKGDTSEDCFNHFFSCMSEQKNRTELFVKYPILKQEMSIFTKQYLSAMKELLMRLYEDYNSLKVLFFNAQSVELQNIKRGGDVHRQGRVVTILEFSSKEQKSFLVYKPRPAGIDTAYQLFIEWINPKIEMKLYQTKYLDKKEYAWFEYISHISCTNQEELRRYYQRLGNLLAVIYLLGGTDIHFENVIAHGEHPVIVDLECLLTPTIGLEHQTLSELHFRTLVIDTFLLPKQQMIDTHYTGFDISAFSGMGGEIAPQKVLEPVNLGKDYMTIERKEIRLSQCTNIPKLNEDIVDPLHYTQEFTQGFIEVYNIFLENITLLKSNVSPLKNFKNKEIRIVIRNTSHYAKLLFESYHPVLLHDSQERIEHFNWLIPKEETSFLHKILESEFKDLLEGNIPIFNCMSDGDELFDSYHKKIQLRIFESGYNRMMNFVENNLSENDKKIQVLCIEQSMIAYAKNKNPNTKEQKYNYLCFTGNSNQAEIRASCLRLAQRELDKILDYCILEQDKVSWTSIDYINANVWRPNRIATDLYNGLSGIMLPFAYGEKIFNNPSYGQIAKISLNTIRKVIRKLKDLEGLTVGGFSGLGGIIYSLYCLYILWKDEKILIDIKILLELCAKIIETQTFEFDIIAGLSGYLAVLETCRSIMSEQEFLILSNTYSQYILTHYSNPEEIPKNHSIPSKKPLLGFAHGTAGIAWSLMKYYQHSKNEDIRIWISKALDYERKLFSSHMNNWPDFRASPEIEISEESNFLTAWCHGATGIGIARLNMKKMGWYDDHIDTEISIALETTIQNQDTSLNLCHGICNKLEFLLNAKEQNLVSNEQLNTHIEAAANYIFTPNKELLYEKLGPVFLPSLMTGAAGIAYQFMRLVFPDVVPSILLLSKPTDSLSL